MTPDAWGHEFRYKELTSCEERFEKTLRKTSLGLFYIVRKKSYGNKWKSFSRGLFKNVWFLVVGGKLQKLGMVCILSKPNCASKFKGQWKEEKNEGDGIKPVGKGLGLNPRNGRMGVGQKKGWMSNISLSSRWHQTERFSFKTKD